MKVEGINNLKVKLHDENLKTLNKVVYVHKHRKNLISFGKLDFLSYEHSFKSKVRELIEVFL